MNCIYTSEQEAKLKVIWPDDSKETFCLIQQVQTCIIRMVIFFFFHPTTPTTTITNITATTSIYYKTVFVFLLLHLYFSSACNESIGLQDGRVKNSQLSASSYYTLKLGHGHLYLYPQYGRIEGLYIWCSQVRGRHLHFPNTYGLFRHGKS